MHGTSAQYLQIGNITDLRIVNGTAVYTADFTPPTAHLLQSQIQNILPMADAGIIDKAQTTNQLKVMEMQNLLQLKQNT